MGIMNQPIGSTINFEIKDKTVDSLPTINYMRIVGTKDEEFIFIVQTGLMQFKVNKNKKKNHGWQKIWVEQIRDACEEFLKQR